jgi:hypothetical protein
VTASNTIVTPEVDWQAAAKAAESLGARTRELVLEGMFADNAEALEEWCLQQANAHVGAGNAVRSLSYFELAVIAGHRPDGLVAELRKPWVELLREAEKLTAAVRVKVQAEAEAEAEAKRKAEDEKRQAEEAETEAKVAPITSDQDEETGA